MNKCHAHRLALTGALVLATVLSFLVPAAAPVDAASSLHLSRSVIAPGDAILVTGYGFTAGGTIVVSADLRVQGAARGVQTTTQADSGGAFSARFGIPAGTNRGIYAVRARDFHGNSAAVNLTVRPRVVLRVGASASLTLAAGRGYFASAAGFEPGETVSFTAVFPRYNAPAQTVAGSAIADANGNVGELFLQIPRRATQGTVSLTALGQHSGKKATATLYVTHYPSISLDPKTVHPGGGTTVSGYGFVPDSTVRIAATVFRTGAPTLTLTKAVATNADGAFVTTFFLPSDTQPGNYVVSATDDAGGFRAQRHLIVAVSSAISLRPGSAFPGQVVAVDGVRYNPNVQVVVTAIFPLLGGGSQPETVTVHANSQGVFSTGLTIPVGASAGRVTVVARGPHSHPAAILNVVRLAATMAVQPNPASPGQIVTVSGAGFSAGVDVTVTIPVPLYGGGSRTVSTVTRTNGQGQYSTQTRIPRHAANGVVTVTARGPHGQRSVQLQIGHIGSSITVSPNSVSPGGRVTISGSGFGPGVSIAISVTIRTHAGTTRTLTLTAATGAAGQFSVALGIPADAAAGSYSVVAKSPASGRVRTATLVVAKLTPSIVALPTTAAPGTLVTVNGFGFEPGATATISFHGQRVGTATTNGNGQFSVAITIPHGLASGAYHITATSSGGRTASIPLTVDRQIVTHFYFASFYTGRGYQEYLALLNPTAINARVTISYQRTNGISPPKTVTVNAHSRLTENVNADLGSNVSAGAVVASDVPIAAERIVYHGSDGAVVPGAVAPSTTWYFANGNTSHGYREFLAIENPNNGPVRVGVTFFPTHHRAFTIFRNMGPTSRTTVKVNSFVRDAVGIRVTSSGPVVANRTIFIHRGMTSKIGVRGPHRTWYFGAGPPNANAHNWIAVINPFNRRSFITLRAYGPLGRELGRVRGYLRPHARAGYLINRIAHQADAAVVLTASRQVVAEQTTYAGRGNTASTDTFGIPTAAKSWEFAAADTSLSGRHKDLLSLFNPSLASVPVVVQFVTASGATVERTYVVAPFNHVRIHVGRVEPNTQLGIVAASNLPFIALNWEYYDNGLGSTTSTGFHS